VNGGTLISTDVNSGIIVGGPFAGSAVLLVRSGSATAERIEFSSQVGATSLLNVAGGSLYIGSGGLVQSLTSSGTTAVRFGSALIGAKDSWSSSLPASLLGLTTFHAADALNAPHDITLSGALSDLGSLEKTGGGTLTLSAVNSYIGTTAVNAGTLLVTGSISGSVTTVNGTGILGGTGALGAVTIANNGTLAPGIGIGIGTLTAGDVTLSGTPMFGLEINIAASNSVISDLLTTANLNLDLANSAVLAVTNLGDNINLDLGTAIPFIDYSGTWNGGTFAGLPDDSTFTLGANQFRISYNGANDNDSAVVLVAIPEPASVALLLGGMALLVGSRRLRRNNLSAATHHSAGE
jgi:autotransporter-associated beta strand protein